MLSSNPYRAPSVRRKDRFERVDDLEEPIIAGATSANKVNLLQIIISCLPILLFIVLSFSMIISLFSPLPRDIMPTNQFLRLQKGWSGRLHRKYGNHQSLERMI